MGTWGKRGETGGEAAICQPDEKYFDPMFGSFFFEKSKMKRYCVSAIEILLIDLKY